MRTPRAIAAALIGLLACGPVLAQEVGATLSQQGTDNRALIDQTGAADGSGTSIEQIGASNYAEAIDAGAGNLLDIEQEGEGQQAEVRLDGSQNDGTLSQYGAANTAILAIGGARNSFRVLQGRAGDPALANTIELSQEGADNFAFQRQFGTGNAMSLVQQGDANAAGMLQVGSDNAMALTQSGDGLGATLEQYGNAAAPISVIQTGVGTSISITHVGAQ